VKNFIPVNEPLLDGDEKAYLLDCLDTGWISSEGPYVKRLETDFARQVGRAHGIAVCNGSAALEVAFAALQIGPGDEVIVPAMTIISCINPIVRSGATPVLVDADADTWNMDVTQLEDKITPRTRAILVVHTYGLPVDMNPVMDLAARHGLAVVEDAAEAIGQTYRGEPCGGFGVLSAFSFYPNKHVTTGEGGMVVTNDESLAERCRSLRNLCFQPERRFVHEELGWNFRMTNLQAALGVAQLERLQSHLTRKREIGAKYNSLLADLSAVQRPLAETEYAQNVYWVYGLVLDDAAADDAAGFMTRLGDRGIGTRPFFWPMHEQPVLRRMGLFAGERYPVAERLARRGFYVPSGLGLSDEQIEIVAAQLRELLA
jgi:perosamine synthetase